MLKQLQDELPKLWTQEQYSDEFKASPSIYKDFDHALKHIRKAVQQLENMTEAADHSHTPLHCFFGPDIKKYLADILISVVRAGLVSPIGAIDLEQAVRDRIERKMGAKLEARPERV